MNILLLTHSVRPRGGVIHTLELADALLRRGHRVTVMASAEPGESLFRETAFPVELIRLPVLTGDLVEQVRQRIEALVQALPPLLQRGGFDLLHAQDSVSGNALALLRARGARLPRWLRTVHHLDDFAQATLNRWQERAWRSADGIACVSDIWCSHFRERFGVRPERMFNGVDLGRYRSAPDAGDRQRLSTLCLDEASSPVCLLVGGVEERKNTVRLLRAFAEQRRCDPTWAHARLVIAGGASMLDHRGARDAWKEALTELDLSEGPGQAVLRTGPLPDEMLPTLMRRADVLAMPSLVEGFGLVALEALACGTPVLVSKRPPFTEHLGDTPGVAWCDPEDTASIAAGLQAAARMPKLTAPPPVCLAHAWEHSAERHEAWYRRVLGPLSPWCRSATTTPCFPPETRHPRPAMPAMHYRLRWPDDSETLCYSPSLVIEDYLQPGADYAVDELVRRVREATAIANERVQAKFGFTCSRAGDQLQQTEARAATFTDRPEARVRVLAFEPA